MIMASQISACCESLPHETQVDPDEKTSRHMANSGPTGCVEQHVICFEAEENNEKPSIQQMARKAAVAISGGALVVVGIPLIPLPGPGCLVIAGGLSILASEFPAAQNVLDKGKEKLENFAAKEKEDEPSDELGLGFTIVDDPNRKQSQASYEKLQCIAKNNIERLRYVTRNNILPLMSIMASGGDVDTGATQGQDCLQSEEI
jgi:uncharacterized protein (TIGR02611 family)